MRRKNIIAIIPARGGSKGIRRKNIRKLAGKPLIDYTIQAAKKSKLIDKIFVSTEDEEIAKVAEKYGAEIIPRPKELAGDFIPTAPVLKHALEYLEKHKRYLPDIVVYLQPTDIFRPKGIIDKVIMKLLENSDLDSVFVAYPTHKNFWRKTKDKYKRIVERKDAVRQKKELIFREDTGLASAARADLIKKGERIGKKIDIVENNDSLSFIDIHDEFDLWLAEKIILSLRKNKKYYLQYEL